MDNYNSNNTQTVETKTVSTTPKFPKWLIPVGAILGLLFLLSSFLIGPYNGLVAKREAVRNKRADLQSAYQRRADLIPNLVSTVEGAAINERTILTEVIDARSRATSVNINADNVTQEQLDQFQQAQTQLSSGLGRLLAVAENYPQIQSNQNFLKLQDEIAGTENRINIARNDYNKVASDFNTNVQTFPTNITARIFGINTEPYFQAQAGSEAAPSVNFNNLQGANASR